VRKRENVEASTKASRELGKSKVMTLTAGTIDKPTLSGSFQLQGRDDHHPKANVIFDYVPA
jgi:hypothetical protein